MLIPVTLYIVRKNMFRKDASVRHIKGWKVWLGKALGGVEIKVGIEG